MKVLVVGAGPAGVATALLLARYGVEVLLIERETTPERQFRGEGLLPLGVDALHEMGVGGVLGEVPSRTIGSWDIWIDGERALVVPEPVAQLGPRAVRVVSQPALLQRLLDRAARYPAGPPATPGSPTVRRLGWPTCCGTVGGASWAPAWCGTVVASRAGTKELISSSAATGEARRCARTPGSRWRGRPRITTWSGSRRPHRSGSRTAPASCSACAPEPTRRLATSRGTVGCSTGW